MLSLAYTICFHLDKAPLMWVSGYAARAYTTLDIAASHLADAQIAYYTQLSAQRQPKVVKTVTVSISICN